jgi:hypothetical protein
MNLIYTCLETHYRIIYGAVCREMFDVPPREKVRRILLQGKNIGLMYHSHCAFCDNAPTISNTHKRFTIHTANLKIDRLHNNNYKSK